MRQGHLVITADNSLQNTATLITTNEPKMDFLPNLNAKQENYSTSCS